MRVCENHEDETSRHMIRQDARMVAVCCYCFIEVGGTPSTFHTCPS